MKSFTSVGMTVLMARMDAETVGLTTTPCGRDNIVEVGVVDGGSFESVMSNPLVDRNPESPLVNRYVEVCNTS